MRETPVFAGEGRRSDLSDRAAAIQAAIGCQKGAPPESAGLTSCSMRRSEMLPISDIAMLR